MTPLLVNILCGVVLAVLVAVAGWALWRGLAAARAGRAQAALFDSLQATLAASPALSMIVRADGRLYLSQPLADRLGHAAMPAMLGDLSGGEDGLEPGSADRLVEAITAAQRGGRPFRTVVRATGSARSLFAIGDRAPDELHAPGGVLVWFFDATEFHDEIATLGHEAEEYRAAFEALSSLIEAAPIPMWYRDDTLRLAMVNTAYVRAVDAADASEVIGRQVELVEGVGLGGPLASASIARDTGQPQAAAMPATIGGARRMLRVHDTPLRDGGTGGFAIDVHEIEEARGGLKRARDAQRSMLDRLSAGVAQFSADRTLEFCNQPFRRTFAMRPEWLADRPEFDRVLERMREAKRLPEVRDFPGWKAERRDWFRAAEGAIEEQWHLPGGTHLRVVAQPLPEGGLLLIFEDRTEQVQLASARDTLLRVRTATFDNLFEALGVFAADGRLQIWNAKFRQVWGLDDAFLDSHPRVDALAERVADSLANPGRATLIPELVRFATQQRMQRSGRFAMADGRHYEFGAVPLPDGNALLTMLDISDSRRVEQALRDRNEALEAADRVKTAFVASMSYELRTPLTSIKGFAEMLQGGYAGTLSEDGGRYTDAILESVERLSGLIDDTLDLTANETAPIARATVPLKLIAGQAVEAVQGDAQARGIELVSEIAPSAGVMLGDARRLRQAMGHLLDHAITGLRPGGRVLLHIDGDAARVRIVVSDDGPGMSPEAVARAFDRFAQAGASRVGERALSVDLPLARQAVEAHGGTIELVSEKGVGTLVTIDLPREP
ncbi:sensor histidine kinase [Sphingomonas sp. Leaf25]|uniref:sensor histidine kinase n=1 Tax=Sphingomonas sp. Leaf25 TaxID=1735692 RepID=UPI0006FD564A|nr:PAS domain-containing sensor histidine kinase [Sphingomonas sp. Leaf25]KQN03723.1 histidine kinase [Sphingomonas sp. Leaf25]